MADFVYSFHEGRSARMQFYKKKGHSCTISGIGAAIAYM